MSWVRYDDGFDSHPKVTLVVAEDPAAIALHVLANTWSSRQRRPGFVPQHQPGVLVGSKQKGARWAALLERAGLWDRVEGGWEFHDHATYRASEKRQSAGTPSDLSAKRAEAGRRGGKAAQQSKQTAKQTVQQNEQRVEQTSSKPCSPVVASNEATPVPVPTSSGVAPPTPQPITAQTIIAEYVEHQRERPPTRVLGHLAKEISGLLADGIDPEAVRRGVALWASRGLNPGTVASVVNEVLNPPTAPGRGRRSTTDRVTAGLALAARLDQEEDLS